MARFLARPFPAYPFTTLVRHFLRGDFLRMGLLVLLTSLIAPKANAQEPLLRGYSVDQGLPQSQVAAMAQDSDRFIWFGTFGGGVGRFDGREFVRYTTDDGLADNSVYAITTDRAGDVWFGTRVGVSRFDGQEFVTMEGISRSAKALALHEDRTGRMWAATENGIRLLEAGRFEMAEGVDFRGIVYAIKEDAEGVLWFGTEEGAFRFDGEHWTRLTREHGLPENTIRAIEQDADGALWFGTHKGVARLRGDAFETFSTADGLPHEVIRTILLDTSGNLWLGMEQGVARYRDGKFSSFGRRELAGVPIWSLLEDHEGNIYFGTSTRGFFSYVPTPFSHLTSDDSFGGQTLWNIAESPNGDIWFGLEGGVKRLRDGVITDLQRPGGAWTNVRSVETDRHGRLWIGSADGVSVMDDSGVHEITVRGAQEIRQVRRIREMEDGSIWVATLGTGAFRVSGGELVPFRVTGESLHTGVYDLLRDSRGRMWFGSDDGLTVVDGNEVWHYDKSDGLASEFVSVITEDPLGNLWFGTFTDGISVMALEAPLSNPGFDNIRPSAAGTSDATSYFLTFDASGYLWLGTNRGLDRINIHSYHESGDLGVKSYGRNEGFVGIEANLHASLLDSRSRMWFGHINGVSMFDPDAARPEELLPVTQLTGLELAFGAEALPGDAAIDTWTGLPSTLALASSQNHLTFDYNGLSFRAPEQVRFRYRLDGFDQAWSRVTTQRSVTFSSLPPGDFTFRVEASLGGERWSTGDTFSFSIATPVWQRPWFVALCIALLGGTVFFFIQARMAQMKRRNAELARRVDERTADLVETANALQDSERKIRYLIENVHDAIFATDAEGVISYMSPVVFTLLGRNSDDFVETPLLDHIMEDDRSKRVKDFKRVIAGESLAREYRMQHSNGDVRWIRISEKPTMLDGTVTAVQCVLTDVTERRALQAQLVQAQKLESIGGLAAGIAHEINTPIQFLSGNTTFLQDCFEDMTETYRRFRHLQALVQHQTGDEIEDAIRAIEAHVEEIEIEDLIEEIPGAIEESLDGLRRVTTIVAAMKEFTHPGSKERQPVDINHVIEATVSMSRAEWKELAEVDLDLADNLPPVPGFQTELSQVFLNMIVNAVHAIGQRPGGQGLGTIRISTARCDDHVEIVLADSGCGMPAHVKDKIFDPFFTTKEVGVGTGQGLSISYNVVAGKHNGSINVDSEEGVGTTFTIRLPVLGAEALAR